MEPSEPLKENTQNHAPSSDIKTDSSCCTPQEKTLCCEPAEKDACCGPIDAKEEKCGCQ